MSALLPCPMCGSANITRYCTPSVTLRWRECETCGIRTAEKKSHDDADAAWNRRTLTPLPDKAKEIARETITSAAMERIADASLRPDRSVSALLRAMAEDAA